ncbi:hypothetical protein EST38_g970 [Candolleomyces aberdarensis]|uniref:Piwi domain-containing protein n=1 Tax=Candolleomyces aberdarensis TaxID=2316362 RepID=A0A4Q2E0R4_9AGAR|nr:hypothetical protein EST38_g970 [Candolleomyces aberdarensis]
MNPQAGNVAQELDNFMANVQKKIPSENDYKAMLKAKGFFLLIILPKEAASLKAAIKHWGDVVRGIPTQCVREDKISKYENGNNRGGSSQYWNNVILKINTRLGGENSRIAGSGAIDYLAKKGKVTMFVGSDVSHPGPGVRKPSVASLVYNQDQLGIKYTAITRLQDPRLEVMAGLEDMFHDALLDLIGIAHGPVTDIIFYRDGVSEGEYDDIRNAEIGAIDRAIEKVWLTHEKIRAGNFERPRLSFIVVGKRHHTLLFPGSHQLGDQKGNCKAGVVVDRDINQPLITDFYLQSHSGIIGTSRSSHYIVLKNEVFNNDTKALQEISFALCHVYAKATRSVSIPAPVYYADLACGRGTFHYAPSVEESLRSQDSESVSSGMNAPFDITPWQEAFQARHPQLKGNMYFL